MSENHSDSLFIIQNTPKTPKGLLSKQQLMDAHNHAFLVEMTPIISAFHDAVSAINAGMFS